jgi:hypothetical protein
MKFQDHLLEGRMLVILTGLYIAFNFTSLAFLFYVIGNFSELKLILHALPGSMTSFCSCCFIDCIGQTVW